MRTFFAFASLLAYCTTLVYATALTYKLEAHEKACFFTNVEHKGTKVAFYFAVSLPFALSAWQGIRKICSSLVAGYNGARGRIWNADGLTRNPRYNPVVLSTSTTSSLDPRKRLY